MTEKLLAKEQVRDKVQCLRKTLPQLIDFESLCHSAKPQKMPLSLKGLIKNYQEAAKNNQLENMKKIEIMFKKYLSR